MDFKYMVKEKHFGYLQVTGSVYCSASRTVSFFTIDRDSVFIKADKEQNFGRCTEKASSRFLDRVAAFASV